MVSFSYAEVFNELEYIGALNVDNDTDVYALHYVFLPRINASLNAFKESWNNHPLSTENNMSPLQLYTAYSLGSCIFDETIDPITYGVDNFASTACDDPDNEGVVIPQFDIPLSSTSLRQLNAEINPSQQCNDFGKELYLNTVQLLNTLMMEDRLI